MASWECAWNGTPISPYRWLMYSANQNLRNKKALSEDSASYSMAGVAGLEPTNAGFRIQCLTNLAIPLSIHALWTRNIIWHLPIHVKKNLFYFSDIRQLPIYRLFSHRLQELIYLGKRPTAKEPSVGRQRTWMRRFHNKMLWIGNHRLFTAGRWAPEDKSNWLFPLIQQRDNLIRKNLPALIPVRISPMSLYCQHCV